LGDEQLKQYFLDGYLVVSCLVAESSIDYVLAHADVSEEELAHGSWHPVIFDFANPTENAHVHRLLVEPSIVAAVEQIFEVPARIYFGVLAVVPGRGGTGLPWHQDNQYDQIISAALNVFIALCDITADKANLWVAPKSRLAATGEKDPGRIRASELMSILNPELGE